jgi:hypothetical protein
MGEEEEYMEIRQSKMRRRTKTTSGVTNFSKFIFFKNAQKNQCAFEKCNDPSEEVASMRRWVFSPSCVAYIEQGTVKGKTKEANSEHKSKGKRIRNRKRDKGKNEDRGMSKRKNGSKSKSKSKEKRSERARYREDPEVLLALRLEL